MPKMKTKSAAKAKRNKKGGPVEIPEMIDMQAYKIMGLTNQSIAEKTGRDRHTVARALNNLEERLPESADLKLSIIERLGEIQEAMMANAETICFAADQQVAMKIHDPETTALDAAKISDMYGKRLLIMSGAKNVGDFDQGEKSPRVMNFINTVINISQNQNDRLRPNAGDEGGTPENDKGRAEVIIEGVVS